MRKHIAVLIVVGSLVLASCNKRARGFEDSPVNQQHIDHTAAEVVDFPNLFGNVTMKCDHHGHRIYATTSHAVTVIADNACADDWNR